MSERHVIAFDAGGSAVKAALYDACGAERAVAAVGWRRCIGSRLSRTRSEAMSAAACEVTRKVLSLSGGEPSTIAAVGLTGYDNGLFLIDRDGKPVRNAILSPDQRAKAIVARWRAAGAEARAVPMTYTGSLPANRCR
jgi:L-xylulokinase